MSNDDWVKSHREMDITTRLLYWAQNEDMIDQYYTRRGMDLLEAENEIIKLRTKYDAMSQVYQENVNQLHDALDRIEYLENALREIDKATISHVDGRDLLDELHPRNMLDIRRRIDGVETWFEGDWLSNLRDARNLARDILEGKS